MIKNIIICQIIFCNAWFSIAAAESDVSGVKMYANHSRLNAQSLNDATKVIRDPTALGNKVKSSAQDLLDQAKDNIQTGINANIPSSRVVQANVADPTQMSGNFRDAVSKMSVRTATTELKTTGSLPPFPNVSIAAIVYSEDQSAYSMLHVDKKTVLVRVGDRASFVDKGKVIEVVVQEINRSDVRLAVYPNNEIIILR